MDRDGDKLERCRLCFFGRCVCVCVWPVCVCVGREGGGVVGSGELGVRCVWFEVPMKQSRGVFSRAGCARVLNHSAVSDSLRTHGL